LNSKDIKVFYTTADIGISIRGKTIEKLFLNAAKGLSLLLVKEIKETSEEKKTADLEFYSDSYEILLVKFLNEILLDLAPGGAFLAVLLRSRTKVVCVYLIAQKSELKFYLPKELLGP